MNIGGPFFGSASQLRVVLASAAPPVVGVSAGSLPPAVGDAFAVDWIRLAVGT